MTKHPSDRARFEATTAGTQDGWIRIAAVPVGFNRDLPNRVIAHAWHDENALDPDFDTMPLDAFVAMVERVMAPPGRRIPFIGVQRTAAE